MHTAKDIEFAVDMLQNSRLTNHDSGLFSYFFRVNSEIGLKLYSSQNSRDRHFENAKIFADAGIGPGVGLKFCLTLKINRYGLEIWYGYSTECVDVTLRKHNDDHYGGNYIRLRYLVNIRSKLKRKAEKLGLKFNDNHLGNIGAKVDAKGNVKKWLIIDPGG